MASKRFRVDWNDIKSGLRHVLVPALAGAAVEGLQTVQPTKLLANPTAQLTATVVLAGIIRLLQRFVIRLPSSPA